MAIHLFSNTDPPGFLKDRSFNYGDGLFSTMHVCNGQIKLWPLHVERFNKGLSALAIPSVDWTAVYDAIKPELSIEDSVLKILVSRGQGGRGYSSQGLISPDVYITKAMFPAHYARWQENGVSLGVAKTRLGLNPWLAGHKHCNRLEQVLIRQDLDNSPFDDALVLDINDHVIECSAANIFWSRQGKWYTPRLAMSGIEGVMKRFLIEQLPELADVTEVLEPVSSIQCADSVFICNSLMGIVPVKSIDGHLYEVDEVRMLQASLAKKEKNETW